MIKLNILAIFLLGSLGLFNYAHADGFPPPTGNDDNNGCGCYNYGSAPLPVFTAGNRWQPSGSNTSSAPSPVVTSGSRWTPSGSNTTSAPLPVVTSGGRWTPPGPNTQPAPLPVITQGGQSQYTGANTAQAPLPTLPANNYQPTAYSTNPAPLPVSSFSPTSQTASVANSVPAPSLPSTGGGGRTKVARTQTVQTPNNLLSRVDSFLSKAINNLASLV